MFVSTLSAFVTWLANHAGFPRHRLPDEAERLLLIAVAAAAEEAATNDVRRFGGQTKDPAATASLKAHALRRSQVHFKCDNSAKV